MTGPVRPSLRLAADEPDQVPRLMTFRVTHPEVVIGGGGFGTWQARIPEENGETVITRYRLGELLDKLDIVLADRSGPGSGNELRGRAAPAHPAAARDGRAGRLRQGRKRALNAAEGRAASAPRLPAPGTTRRGLP